MCSRHDIRCWEYWAEMKNSDYKKMTSRRETCNYITNYYSLASAVVKPVKGTRMFTESSLSLKLDLVRGWFLVHLRLFPSFLFLLRVFTPPQVLAISLSCSAQTCGRSLSQCRQTSEMWVYIPGNSPQVGGGGGGGAGWIGFADECPWKGQFSGAFFGGTLEGLSPICPAQYGSQHGNAPSWLSVLLQLLSLLPPSGFLDSSSASCLHPSHF